MRRKWLRGRALMAAVALGATGGISAEAGGWLAESGRSMDGEEMMGAVVSLAGEGQLVLLGEASHGTHEFYTYRDGISRRLIEGGGIRFIAVEGDWVPLQGIDRYVRGYGKTAESAAEVLAGLTRWPTWMWANKETAALAEWLREWNLQRPMEERVGFHGMDVYSPWDAADALLEFAGARMGDAAEKVRAGLAILSV